jgi:hypothetical protein
VLTTIALCRFRTLRRGKERHDATSPGLVLQWNRPSIADPDRKEHSMTKGMDRKKETKKKPAKTMKEKKADKAAKKSGKS